MLRGTHWLEILWSLMDAGKLSICGMLAQICSYLDLPHMLLCSEGILSEVAVVNA